MSRKSRVSKGKTINPTFFVFCEGQTEEQYLNYLRLQYRLPIIIDSKISGNRINEKYISEYKKTKDIHPKDKTFLVYDLDISGMLDNLQSIKNTILISSNPCFELWYLLHCQDQRSFLTAEDCHRRLSVHCKYYKKGSIDSQLKSKLREKQEKAMTRAHKLVEHQNPSTLVYRFIIALEEVRKESR